MKEFQITSGKIVASDPAYSIPTWCQGIIENVKNGTWVVIPDKHDVRGWGERVCKLTVTHKDFNFDNFVSEELPFVGGVDSGQFGFFDYDLYRNDESAKDLEKYNFGDDFERESGDIWYRAVCHLTLSSDHWGVLPNGAVSSSGIGDGSYPVYGIKDKDGQYIGFQVIFIDEDTNEEDEWEECSNCGTHLNYDGSCDNCDIDDVE